LLVSKPNCGVRVAPDAPDLVRELVIPIRRAVETCALKLFYDTINEEDFRHWNQILARWKEACARGDYITSVEQDIAFHRSLVQRAGQPDLLAIWSTIVARVRSHFRLMHQKASSLMELYDEHAAIVEAFKSGNKEAAIAALESKIE